MAVLADRPAALRAWLDQVSQTPFIWGQSDCLTGLVAGWIEQVRGIDPAAPWRGRYSTEIGAALLAYRAGGLVALMDAAAASCGLGRTETPGLGDVGVTPVLAGGVVQLAGAIASPSGWALLQPSGLMISPARPVAAWRI